MKVSIQPDTFSLDAYAQKKGMSDLDLTLIKCYLDMPREMRATFMEHLRESLISTAETAIAVEPSSQEQEDEEYDPDKDEDVQNLIREKRLEKISESSASQVTGLKKDNKDIIS